GVPPEMKSTLIDQALRTDFEATETPLRRARPGVIPRADDQIVSRAGCRRAVLKMSAVVGQCPALIVVVTARDREDRELKLAVLLDGRVIHIPVGMGHWMSEPLLEMLGRVPQHLIQRLEGSAGFEPLAKSLTPEGLLIREELLLRGAAPDQRQPLHE